MLDCDKTTEDGLDLKREPPGYVYVMTTEIYFLKGVHKVGWSADIEKRSKTLSASTSAAEEFFVEYFVRCRTVTEARKLEAHVKDALKECGAQVRDRREFYRVGTVVGLIGCILDSARTLGIRVVENVRADPIDILENDMGTIVSTENLQSMNPTYEQLYRRGARDLACLLMLAGEPKDVACIARHIYGRLEGTVPSSTATSLIQIVEEAVSMAVGPEAATRFVEELRECQESDKLNQLFGDRDEAREWRAFIDTDPNWPRAAS